MAFHVHEMCMSSHVQPEHTPQKPAAIIELKVIPPTTSNYITKKQKITINRPFLIFVSSRYRTCPRTVY